MPRILDFVKALFCASALWLARFGVNAQGRPMLESEVPPGLRAWLGKDNCGADHWTGFLESIRDAVAQANRGQMMAALGSLATLLASVASDPWKAFDCSTAVASAASLAAQICDQSQAPLVAARVRQEMAVWSAFDYQMKGEEFIDNSPWPIQWAPHMQDILRSMHGLKQREVAAEPWRALPMRRALNEGFTVPDHARRLSIAVVSVCDYDAAVTPLAMLSWINKQAYGNRHGYTIKVYEKAPVFEDPLTPLLSEPISHRPAAWSKVDALLAALAEGEHEWVMWMDCDSFFMDPDTRLEDVIAASERPGCGGGQDDLRSLVSLVQKWQAGPDDRVPRSEQALLSWYDYLLKSARWSGKTKENAACHGKDHGLHSAAPVNETLGWGNWIFDEHKLHLIASEDGLMLNTGNVLLRASPWSWQFLQKVRWMTFGRSPVTQHPWWEQTAMVYLLQMPFTLTHLLLLSQGRSPQEVEALGSHTPACRMLSQRHINTYPPLVAAALVTHESFELGDFIVSFSGCKVYSSQEVCNQLFLSHFFQVHDINELRNHPGIQPWL